jgi:type I restriction enzyme S subunit
MLPEGWAMKSIMDVPQFRFMNETVKPFRGRKLYYATADVEGISIVGTGLSYEYEEKPSRAQKQPLPNSVWFARMKDTYKVLCFTEVNRDQADRIMLSSGFVGFEAADGWLGFLYSTINSAEFHRIKDQFCTGATQMSLTNEGLRRIQIVVPPDSLVRDYNKTVLPMVSSIIWMQQKSDVLQHTRDFLLPKLISGEIDITSLDIKMEGDKT